jgi:hypothetical protein
MVRPVRVVEVVVALGCLVLRRANIKDQIRDHSLRWALCTDGSIQKITAISTPSSRVIITLTKAMPKLAKWVSLIKYI